jgi:hypothetical protein
MLQSSWPSQPNRGRPWMTSCRTWLPCRWSPLPLHSDQGHCAVDELRSHARPEEVPVTAGTIFSPSCIDIKTRARPNGPNGDAGSLSSLSLATFPACRPSLLIRLCEFRADHLWIICFLGGSCRPCFGVHVLRTMKLNSSTGRVAVVASSAESCGRLVVLSICGEVLDMFKACLGGRQFWSPCTLTCTAFR